MPRILLAFAACLLASAAALAFGTEPGKNGLGSEHERITRAAVTDLDPATLDALAGKGEAPGAVGIVDAVEAFRADQAAHCDGGDFLDVEADATPYGQTAEEAQAALTACRTRIMAELNAAVVAAAKLATPQAEDIALDCDFAETQRNAKCAVLAHLGRAFHTAQDFYARTNWVDTPATGPVTAENPPGLKNVGRAKWLDPRTTEPFPAGLVSGCPGEVDVLGVTIGCEYGSWAPVNGLRRILRADLSKDFGPIGRGKGGAGTTARGSINRNFARAVEAAVEDTIDKWAFFKERVRQEYPDAASTIICSVMSDTADITACLAKQRTVEVCARRTTSDDPASPPAESERQEAATLWPDLRKYCRLEELDLTRNATISGGVAADGLAAGQAKAEDLLASWNACPAQGRQHLDAVTAEHKAAIHAEKDIDESKAKPKPKLRDLLATIYADCILDARLRQLGK